MSPEHQESDLNLLHGLKEGKRECYEALYHRYAQPIYRFIYAMVHQKEASEDLVQEVFFKQSELVSLGVPYSARIYYQAVICFVL